MKFTAATRATQGTSASRRLRREAKVPAILYGLNQPAAMIAIDHNEMFYALQKEKFHSSILTMELDGTEQLVVLRAFQMHPYKNQVLHMDFQRIDPNANVTMRVPLHFFGGENSPAVKIDKGLISHLVGAVEVSCLPKDLPEFIAQFVASTAVPFSKKRGRTQPKPVLCRRHPLGAAAENGFFRYLRFSERFDLRPIA